MRWCLSYLPPPNHLCKAVSPSTWSSLPVWLWLMTESRTVQSRMWCHQSWWQCQLKAYLHSRVGKSSHSFTWMWDQPLHHWIPPHQSFLGGVRLYSVSTSASKTSSSNPSSLSSNMRAALTCHDVATQRVWARPRKSIIQQSYEKSSMLTQCCNYLWELPTQELFLWRRNKVFVCVNMSVHMLVFACMTIWQMGMHLNSVIYTNYCLSMSFSSFIVRCMNIKQEKVCIDRNKKEGNWKRRKHKEQSQNMYMFVCHVCWLRG